MAEQGRLEFDFGFRVTSEELCVSPLEGKEWSHAREGQVEPQRWNVQFRLVNADKYSMFWSPSLDVSWTKS